MRFALVAAALSATTALARPVEQDITSLWARAASSVTTDVTRATSQQFDYIIVGAGLAGLTNAMRLSEDKKTKVLVLEAGADVSGRTSTLAACGRSLTPPTPTHRLAMTQM